MARRKPITIINSSDDSFSVKAKRFDKMFTGNLALFFLLRIESLFFKLSVKIVSPVLSPFFFVFWECICQGSLL